MKKVLITGCRSSGKSSLVKTLCSILDDVLIIDNINPIPETRDNTVLENYVLTQKEFISYFVDQQLSIKNTKSTCLFQAKGPESLYYYTLYYPSTHGYDWDISAEMEDDLKELESFFSDIIVMLDYDKDVIINRWNTDHKKRNKQSEWLDYWFNGEKQFFENYDNLIRITDSSLSTIEIAQYLIDVLKNKYKIPLKIKKPK